MLKARKKNAMRCLCDAMSQFSKMRDPDSTLKNTQILNDYNGLSKAIFLLNTFDLSRFEIMNFEYVRIIRD